LDQNVKLLFAKFEDSVNVRTVINRCSREELDLKLAIFKGGEVTVKRFLENYGAGVTIKFTPALLGEAINNLSRSMVFEKLAIDDGFMESEEYRIAVLSTKENMIVKKTDDSILSSGMEVSESDLRSFFSRNRARYRTDGNVIVSEISSGELNKITEIQKAVLSGVDFEKAATSNTGSNKNANVKMNSSTSFNFLTKNELAARAIKMNKKEISDIIIRKDGGYSMIKIIEKYEPQLLSYNSARRNVEKDYKKNQLKNMESELLSGLRKRWPVVIYEKNLSGVQ
jgi:hypothetical protein